MVAPWGPRAGLGCSCSCSWQGAVPACPLSLLWLCRGWPGPLEGFSTPSHRILRSASSPMPCKVHALAGKWPHGGGKSVCLLFTLLQPHPGTSSPRHILTRVHPGQGRGEHSEAATHWLRAGPGAACGVRTPPEHPQSIPGAGPTHVVHPRTIPKELPRAVRGCAVQLAASERLVGSGAGWAEGARSHWHDTAQPLWLMGTALTSVFPQELETSLQAHHLHTSVHPRDEPPHLPCS